MRTPFTLSLIVIGSIIGSLVIGCGGNDTAPSTPSTTTQPNIVLNSVPLHLGDNSNQAPLYGSQFTGSGNVTGSFSSAILSVHFLGEIDWPISSPTTIISGVDIGPPTTFPTGVEVFFNGQKVGPAPSDFPNIPACVSAFNEYICPFEYTVNVTSFVLNGQNDVIVRSTPQALNLDDFAIDNVVIRFQ